MRTIFSSKSDCWATPQYLFDELNEEFHFNLDPCCNEENAKCERHFTQEDDGLSQYWGGARVFCNPPYGRVLYHWVEKCAMEATNPGSLIVLLVPSRTDTKWFHNFIWQKPNVEIRFVKGRLHFNDADSAPFASMIVIFNPQNK